MHVHARSSSSLPNDLIGMTLTRLSHPSQMRTRSQRVKACGSCHDPGRGRRPSRTSQSETRTQRSTAGLLLREAVTCLSNGRRPPQRLGRFPLLLPLSMPLRDRLGRGQAATRPPRRLRSKSCTTFRPSRERPVAPHSLILSPASPSIFRLRRPRNRRPDAPTMTHSAATSKSSFTKRFGASIENGRNRYGSR